MTTISERRNSLVTEPKGEIGAARADDQAEKSRDMSKPESTAGGLVFDLATDDHEMRAEDAYIRDGHTARTLVRKPDLSIVLVVMKAGGRMADHHATGSIQALSGHARLRVLDAVIDLPAGRLLVLGRGLRH